MMIESRPVFAEQKAEKKMKMESEAAAADEDVAGEEEKK